MSRLKKNFFASIYFYFANQAGLMVQVAAFLRFWDTRTYGAWLVINTIPACMTFSDGGVGSSLGNRLTLDYQQKNYADAECAFSSVWYCQLRIWLVLVGAFVASVWILPFESWLGLSQLSHTAFATTASLMCIWTLLGLQASILSSIYRAGGTYDRFVSLNAHFRIIETVVVVLMLVGGAQFILVATGLLAVRIVYLWWFWQGARNQLPEVQLSRQNASWKTFRELLPSGFAFLSFSLGAGLINQGTALAANHVFGPASVAVVNTCRQLARVYLNVTSMAFTAIQPEMTYAYGQGDLARGLSLQRRALGTVLYLAPVFCLCTAAFGPYVIRWWSHAAIQVDFQTMFFFALEASLVAIGNVAVMSAWSLNKNIGIAVIYISTHGAALLLIVMGASSRGIAAIPAIFSIAGLIYSLCGLVVSARVVNMGASRLLMTSLNPGVWRTQP